MSETNDRSSSKLPENIVVTLRASGIFFAIANVICVAIIAWSYVKVKMEPKTLSVTGSVRKAVVSDVVTWEGSIRANDPSLSKAYELLEASAEKAKAFVTSSGIAASEITLSAVTTERRFKKEILPGAVTGNRETPVAPAVIDSDKVEMYTLTQMISIRSSEMQKVPEISRTITSLIKDGVEIDSDDPRFLYTKASEMKINLLAEATKDATLRAEQIVNNANGRLGRLVEARMGVMQINPKGVTATSYEGINDTTAYEKEITAIVSVKFEVL